MARLTECPPCQMGEHKNHYRVVQHAPEGGVGGAICDCKGECRNRTPDERLRRMGLNPNIMRFLRRRHG